MTMISFLKISGARLQMPNWKEICWPQAIFCQLMKIHHKHSKSPCCDVIDGEETLLNHSCAVTAPNLVQDMPSDVACKNFLLSESLSYTFPGCLSCRQPTFLVVKN
jgi:hypothetical protein